MSGAFLIAHIDQKQILFGPRIASKTTRSDSASTYDWYCAALRALFIHLCISDNKMLCVAITRAPKRLGTKRSCVIAEIFG